MFVPNLSISFIVLFFLVCLFHFLCIGFSSSGIYIWIICEISTNLFIFLN